jgi:hypothetical protein
LTKYNKEKIAKVYCFSCGRMKPKCMFRDEISDNYKKECKLCESYKGDNNTLGINPIRIHRKCPNCYKDFISYNDSRYCDFCKRKWRQYN